LITNLVISGALVLLGLGVFPLGIYYDFPEPVLNKRIMIVLFGAIWVGLALALFVTNFRNLGQRVLVYSDGFTLHKGGAQTVCKWDDIAAVWRDSATPGSVVMAKTTLTIQTKIGRTVVLTEFFARMNTLVDIVLAETQRRIFPAVQAELDDGRSVKFGNIRINPRELIEADKELPWSQAAIEVTRGLIYIRRKGDGQTWYFDRVKDVPNYHVFLAIAAELLRKNSADEPLVGP
jgi:hypothetical protein